MPVIAQASLQKHIECDQIFNTVALFPTCSLPVQRAFELLKTRYTYTYDHSVGAGQPSERGVVRATSGSQALLSTITGFS